MSANLPYDPLLFVDYDRLPDGIYVELWHEAVPVAAEARTRAVVTASLTMPTGHYVVPIIARSGDLERLLNISIEVVPLQPAALLPLMMR